MADLRKFIIAMAIIDLLLIAFYLSPFSEISFMNCYTPQNVPNPAGAQLSPICGIDVLPSDVSSFFPPFPFRSRNSEFIDFCRRNIQTVENSCNMKVGTTLIELLGNEGNENDEYKCDYLFNNRTSEISLKKYVEPPTSEEIQLYGLDMIYLEHFAVSMTSGRFDYDPSLPEFDYKNCTDLKARLR